MEVICSSETLAVFQRAPPPYIAEAKSLLNETTMITYLNGNINYRFCGNQLNQKIK
jgi:hypothetical protein